MSRPVTRLASRHLFWFVLWAVPALASASYPADIQTDLTLSGPPPQSCALCHSNGITGMGTVNTPFGRSARAHGLVAQDDAKLKSVLAAMKADGTDSDGDGVPDIAELIAGTDPNVNGNAELAEPLRYGCGAQAVPGALLGLIGWLWSRRRGRGTSPSGKTKG